MLDGSWSVRNLPLAPRTVNLRVDEACSFLSWAAQKSLRPEFKVVTGTVFVRHPRKRAQQITEQQRAGRVRPAVTALYMPSQAKVDRWLASVHARSGRTKGLMCEAIIGSGIRREEVVQLRKTSIPPTEDVINLQDDANVEIEITFGAKGPKIRTGKDELRGPSRTVFMSAALVKGLCAYRDGLRNESLAKYVREADSLAERRQRMKSHGNRLFISEATGRPVTAERIYEAWTQAPHCPYLGWSPHPGRHYWACHKLLSLMRIQSNISRAQAIRDPLGFDNTARTLLQILIQPQLGHVDEETTLLYLRWLRMSFLATDIADDWNSAMDDEQ